MKPLNRLMLSSLFIALVFSASVSMAQDTNTGEVAVQSEGAPAVAPASPGAAAIMFEFGPLDAAPPPTLGGLPMTPVPDPGAPACTGILPPGPIPTPGGDITVSPWSSQRCIGSGWATWSHGYVGDVYYSDGATSQTITLPPGTGAFYFYVEPDPFALHTFYKQDKGG